MIRELEKRDIPVDDLDRAAIDLSAPTELYDEPLMEHFHCSWLELRLIPFEEREKALAILDTKGEMAQDRAEKEKNKR